MSVIAKGGSTTSAFKVVTWIVDDSRRANVLWLEKAIWTAPMFGQVRFCN
jgi:hypothetical protein